MSTDGKSKKQLQGAPKLGRRELLALPLSAALAGGIVAPLSSGLAGEAQGRGSRAAAAKRKKKLTFATFVYRATVDPKFRVTYFKDVSLLKRDFEVPKDDLKKIESIDFAQFQAQMKGLKIQPSKVPLPGHLINGVHTQNSHTSHNEGSHDNSSHENNCEAMLRHFRWEQILRRGAVQPPLRRVPGRAPRR